MLFCRGCQNGLVYVWTLPQGGTIVSLPNIFNSPTQDKNPEVRVSFNFLPNQIHQNQLNRYQKYYKFSVPVLHLWLYFPLLCQQESAKCSFVLHGHITAVKSLSFCFSGLALVSGGIGGLLNIWSLQVRESSGQHTPPATDVHQDSPRNIFFWKSWMSSSSLPTKKTVVFTTEKHRVRIHFWCLKKCVLVLEMCCICYFNYQVSNSTAALYFNNIKFGTDKP